MSVRIKVAKAIAEVVKGRSLRVTQAHLLNQLSPPSRPLANALLLGTIRHWHRLVYLSDQLMEKPLAAKHIDVQALLAIALFELQSMQTAEYAVVSECVNAINKIKKPWAKSFVNAVLRRYQREREDLEEQLSRVPSWRYSAPSWLMDALFDEYPKQAQQIFAAYLKQTALYLRVNQAKLSRDEYIEKLQQQGIRAQKSDLSPMAIAIEESVNISELVGFAEGEFSVQSETAQLAMDLISPYIESLEHCRVLDACAAPGGKSCHLLEKFKHIDLTVADSDEERLLLLHENVARLDLDTKQLNVVCRDSTSINAWENDELFDVIIIDAPCSGTGVIAKHPDIKIHRHPDDIMALIHTQRRLLLSLLPRLKVGGRLLYLTCSILAAENQQQMTWLSQAVDTVKFIDIDSQFGEQRSIGRQHLPDTDGGQGFYYALLEKTA